MKSRTSAGISQIRIYVLRILCGFCILFFFTALGMLFSDSEEEIVSIVMSILFPLLAICCIVASRRISRLLADFRTYTAILSSDPVKTVDRIAEMTGETAETVRIKVNRMIEKNYFVNAYIDQSGKIVLADREQMNQVVGNNNGRKDFVTIVCPSCGGVNRLTKGQVGKCEFCGAYISDKV